jgi:carboxyl-terminal processing protease
MPRRNSYLLLFFIVTCLACAWKVSPYGRVLMFAMDEIEQRALEKVGRKDLFEGAMQGMTDRLDVYSTYMPPAVAEEFEQAIDQQFGGVGMEVLLDPDTEQLTVASPLVGSPAYEAGIRAGDRILRIDGQSTQGLSLEDCVKRMRGKPGDPVMLTILRTDQDQPENVQIVRAVIQVESVLGDTRDPDGTWNYFLQGYDRIGYLRINSFNERTARELDDAVKWLVDHDMQGLVLDLRNDPGGLLDAAITICDMFIDSGTIVSIRQRDAERIVATYAAGAEGTYKDFPMAVLVNGYSASASEIVAACLQDHGRAVVVGQRSYGKGTVQELINLQPGQGTLKLTTSSYWRPSGKNIHRREGAGEDADWGVRPDKGYEVELDDKQMVELAVWRRNRDLSKANGKNGTPAAEDDSYFDPQLKKAIEYVRGKLQKPQPEAESP